MYEKPLERLNYFNGQRLEALDLKTEQDYHIRTRRWLNKSLYSAGIGRGLEVRKVPPDIAKKDPPRVGVSLGLAIDDDGREIILLEEALIEVCSYSGSGESTVVGNYLVIEYAEETQAFEKNGGCGVRETGARTSTSTTNFGGPSRVQAKPKFSWIPFPPQPGSNQIALARVELGSDCATVHQIDTGIRRYIGAASAAKVRQYALEGERHIDKDNPGRIYFHIRGRQPNSVTLYLRAEKFSTLYYTEMGGHSHSLTVTAGIETTAPILDSANPNRYKHTHTLQQVTISNESSHEHSVLEVTFLKGAADVVNDRLLVVGLQSVTQVTPTYGNILPVLDSRPEGRILGWPSNNLPDPPLRGEVFKSKIAGASPHNHLLRKGTSTTAIAETDNGDGILDHKHNVTPEASLGSAGVTDTAYSARGGDAQDPPHPINNPIKPLTYVDDLQVLIGESVPGLKNKTKDILDQLRDAQQGLVWDKLGDGESNHVLALEGTGAIRLDFLPDVTFTDREYVIDLKVTSGGGRILYNLYIE